MYNAVFLRAAAACAISLFRPAAVPDGVFKSPAIGSLFSFLCRCHS
jgi:hypothetical protein